MLPKDTNSNRTGPNEREDVKLTQVQGVNVRSISVLRRFCPAMFDSTRKALGKGDSV